MVTSPVSFDEASGMANQRATREMFKPVTMVEMTVAQYNKINVREADSHNGSVLYKEIALAGVKKYPDTLMFNQV